jgi:hypothetical protein
MTIAEGNKLILDYMESNKGLHECNYHQSIDSLMPVVYKLCNEGYDVNMTICKLDINCSMIKDKVSVSYSDPHLGSDVWKCITDILSKK